MHLARSQPSALARFTHRVVPFAIALVLVATCRLRSAEPGFRDLFDGATLSGWVLKNPKGEGYQVKDGAIVCVRGGGGNLFTEEQFTDFEFRFEFKLEPGSNNGLGIRAPLEGDAAYLGMELQILDDSHPKYASLRPTQFHGSIYDVVPSVRGALKPPGEWNRQEVRVVGRRVTVVLNGRTILNTDIHQLSDPGVLAKHPGLLRDEGHIGFLGHNDYAAFRNIRVKNLAKPRPDAVPPEGFSALFNGADLKGWQGLLAAPHDNPLKRAQLPSPQREEAQAAADLRMRAHWKVIDGALEFDGKGDSLASRRDYADFELLVDWKIPPNGDSGIYLRGCPQVQIWDPSNPKYNPKAVGSGGLYNNQRNPSTPGSKADRPVGQWNRFRILMQGERVTVFLNGTLVVHHVPLENYWERAQPIPTSGPIELQNHGDALWFKNIFIRELPRKP